MNFLNFSKHNIDNNQVQKNLMLAFIMKVNLYLIVYPNYMFYTGNEKLRFFCSRDRKGSYHQKYFFMVLKLRFLQTQKTSYFTLLIFTITIRKKKVLPIDLHIQYSMRPILSRHGIKMSLLRRITIFKNVIKVIS